MNEQTVLTLKGIATLLDYMASADTLDCVHTQEALALLADDLFEIIEEQNCNMTET